MKATLGDRAAFSFFRHLPWLAALCLIVGRIIGRLIFCHTLFLTSGTLHGIIFGFFLFPVLSHFETRCRFQVQPIIRTRQEFLYPQISCLIALVLDFLASHCSQELVGCPGSQFAVFADFRVGVDELLVVLDSCCHSALATLVLGIICCSVLLSSLSSSLMLL